MDPVVTTFLAGAAKDLALNFGPEVIKLIWAKINGDDSQDAQLKKIGKKKFKEIERLEQIRRDFTEARIIQDSLENHKAGKNILSSGNLKQQEKRLAKLEKTFKGYYNEFPQLKEAVEKKDFNKVQDDLKGEIGKEEQKANEAIEAVKQGKSAASGVQGNNPDQQRFQQYSPEQVSAMNSLLNIGRQGLEGNKFDFAPIEEEARAGFAQKTIPSIAERFTKLNAQKSSAFPQLLSQAGADLERSLAAMKQNYNLSREGNLSNLLNLGLRPQYGHAGPLIGGLPQQGANIDKFAEYLPQALSGAGDFISKLFAKKDQAGQAQANELSNLKNKVGGSYQALQAVYPEAFKGKTVLPESFNPSKVTNMQALQALYPQAFGDAGVSNQTIEDSLASLGQQF